MPYRVEGTWVAYQSNGPVITFNLTRDDMLLTGSASYAGGQSTDLRGRVTDNAIVMTITWRADSVGEYNGTFGVDDRLYGHTFDLREPGQQATWYTTQGFIRGT